MWFLKYFSYPGPYFYFQANSLEDGEEGPDRLDKLEFKQSDVLGEALCAVIAHDAKARYSVSIKAWPKSWEHPVSFIVLSLIWKKKLISLLIQVQTNDLKMSNYLFSSRANLAYYYCNSPYSQTTGALKSIILDLFQWDVKYVSNVKQNIGRNTKKLYMGAKLMTQNIRHTKIQINRPKNRKRVGKIT